jgi:hypothetical protein
MRTPALGARATTQDGKHENSPTNHPGQAITLPVLTDARARLVDVIRQRPAPKPNYWTAADEARLARRSRPADAQRILRPIEGNVAVATAIGVSTRAIVRWRAGTRHPSVRHWQQIRALHGLLWRRP